MARVPVVVEPDEAPVPLPDVPVQAPDAQAAKAVAIDRSPEENVLAFPLFGDVLRVGQIPVQHIGVHHRHVLELTAKLRAFYGLAVLLAGVELQYHLRRVEGEVPTLRVRFDFPAVGRGGVSVEVDDNCQRLRWANLLRFRKRLGVVDLGTTLGDIFQQILCTGVLVEQHLRDGDELLNIERAFEGPLRHTVQEAEKLAELRFVGDVSHDDSFQIWFTHQKRLD